MTVDQLRKAYHARPFQPFTINVADGRQLRVPHFEFMSFSPSGRTITVTEEDDSVHVVGVLLITQIVFDGRKPRRVRREES